MRDAKITWLVTGGAGFIGSAVCRLLCRSPNYRVINLDKLTYAATPNSLHSVADHRNYLFVHGDIADQALVSEVLRRENVDIIMNLAAESHVDRSIDGPAAFVATNVGGTFGILSAALDYFKGLTGERRERFRFHHVSTDEVFGDLPFNDERFTEDSKYAPSSPYSATKAASDHLVHAWHKTYGLPTVISNCSNNYGPFHFPEKLIPLVIINALDGRELPIYGSGSNVRDWLFVEDHARALEAIATNGQVGDRYNVGGNEERSNLSVVQTICDLLDNKRTKRTGSYSDQIGFVADRPGHDRRYAVDASKIGLELGWRPTENFTSGLSKTVDWYLNNEWWWRPLREQRYSGARLGGPATALDQRDCK